MPKRLSINPGLTSQILDCPPPLPRSICLQEGRDFLRFDIARPSLQYSCCSMVCKLAISELRIYVFLSVRMIMKLSSKRTLVFLQIQQRAFSLTYVNEVDQEQHCLLVCSRQSINLAQPPGPQTEDCTWTPGPMQSSTDLRNKTGLEPIGNVLETVVQPLILALVISILTMCSNRVGVSMLGSDAGILQCRICDHFHSISFVSHMLFCLSIHPCACAAICIFCCN